MYFYSIINHTLSDPQWRASRADICGSDMTNTSQHHAAQSTQTTRTNGPVSAYRALGPPDRRWWVAGPEAERLRCSWRRRGRSGLRSALAWRPDTPSSPQSVSSPRAASRAVPAARRRGTHHGAPGGGCGRPCTQGRRGECQGEGIGASEKQKKSMGPENGNGMGPLGTGTRKAECEAIERTRNMLDNRARADQLIDFAGRAPP